MSKCKGLVRTISATPQTRQLAGAFNQYSVLAENRKVHGFNSKREYDELGRKRTRLIFDALEMRTENQQRLIDKKIDKISPELENRLIAKMSAAVIGLIVGVGMFIDGIVSLFNNKDAKSSIVLAIGATLTITGIWLGKRIKSTYSQLIGLRVANEILEDMDSESNPN